LKIKSLSRPLRRERIKPRVGAFFFCADIADNADTAGSWFVSHLQVRMRPEVGRPSNTGTRRPTGERCQAGLRRATDAPSCARQAHGEEYGHPREDAVTGQNGAKHRKPGESQLRGSHRSWACQGGPAPRLEAVGGRGHHRMSGSSVYDQAAPTAWRFGRPIIDSAQGHAHLFEKVGPF
jgi:hypothetical protein